MKKYFVACLLFSLGIFAYSQSPIGVWKTIDDKTGKEKSHVKIYETQSGKLQAEVVKILTPGKEDAKCTECKGAKKDKPISGMVILWGLEKDNEKRWDDGRILDPNSGKEYDCRITVKDKNTLEVRGYMGVPTLGRTQTWTRVE